MDPDDLSTRGLLKRIYRFTRRMEVSMTQMSEALGRLSQAVTGMRSDMQDKIDALQAALDDERAQDASDEAAVQAAQEATDQARQDLQDAVSQVDQLATQVSDAQAADPGGSAGGDVPVDDSGSGTGTGDQPAPVDEGALPADDSGDPGVPVDDSQDVVSSPESGDESAV